MAARALAVRELVGPRLRPVEAARGRRVLRVDGPRPRDRAPTRRTGAGTRGRRGGRARAPILLAHTDELLSEFPHAVAVAVFIWWLDRTRRRHAWTAADTGDLLALGALGALAFNFRRESLVLVGVIAAAQLVDAVPAWRAGSPVRWRRARDSLPRVRRRCGDRPTGAPVDRVPRQQRRARPHSPAARRLRDGAPRATRPRSPAAARRDHLGARGRRHRGGLHPPTGARRAPGRAHHPLRPRGQHPFPHRRPVLLPDPPVDALLHGGGGVGDRPCGRVAGPRWRADGSPSARRRPRSPSFPSSGCASRMPPCSKGTSPRRERSTVGLRSVRPIPPSSACTTSVRAVTSPDDVVAFLRPRTMTLLTGRRSLQPTSLDDVVRSADWFAQLQRSSPWELSLTPAEARASGLVPVWQDLNWVLWRVDPGGS